MIYNATLLRVDVPAVDGGGNVTFTNGSALSVRCAGDAVKSGQRYQLGAVIADATAVIYLLRKDIPAALVIEKGYRLVAQLDGEPAAVTYHVEWKNPRIKGQISHYELYLRQL